MSEDKDKVVSSGDSPLNNEGESSALTSTDPQVGAKLQEIIEAIPEPKREGVRHSLQEFFGYIERSGPKIDPEVARILVTSNDRDNENKFHYLTQKETNRAEQAKRDHDFKVARHKSQVKMLWPVLISIIILVLGCIGAGIYLAATGRDTLGFSILSATISAVFAFFGGWGMAHFFKNE